MNCLIFPAKRFISKGKGKINRDEQFCVQIQAEIRKRVFMKNTSFLFEEDINKHTVFSMVMMFFLLFRYLVVHFYALTSNYKIYYDYKNKSNLNIYFKKLHDEP